MNPAFDFRDTRDDAWNRVDVLASAILHQCRSKFRSERTCARLAQEIQMQCKMIESEGKSSAEQSGPATRNERADRETQATP